MVLVLNEKVVGVIGDTSEEEPLLDRLGTDVVLLRDRTRKQSSKRSVKCDFFPSRVGLSPTLDIRELTC